uniref:Uncharacterized protein n=1 Tax=Oryza nivara TaxID=4536 RepID=A0A0E0H165_ORYNI
MVTRCAASSMMPMTCCSGSSPQSTRRGGGVLGRDDVGGPRRGDEVDKAGGVGARREEVEPATAAAHRADAEGVAGGAAPSWPSRPGSGRPPSLSAPRRRRGKEVRGRTLYRVTGTLPLGPTAVALPVGICIACIRRDILIKLQPPPSLIPRGNTVVSFTSLLSDQPRRLELELLVAQSSRIHQ